MIKKLTVRPIPVKGESLSSFLLYIAHKNRIRIHDLLRLGEALSYRYITHLDLNHNRIIKLSNLSKITGIEENALSKMSMYPMLATFLDEADLSDEKYRSFLPNMINTDFRRYCPKCLHEGTRYQLKWQINELSKCENHHMDLTSRCFHCNHDQPYAHDYLMENKCYKCQSTLYQLSEVNKEQTVDEEQIELHRQWDDFIKVQGQNISWPSESKSQSLSIMCLYVAQREADLFSMSELLIYSNDYKCRLVKFIQGEEKRGYRATLSLLHLTLRQQNISLQYFLGIKVPARYIESIKDYDSSRKIEPRCITPWCTSYNTSDSIININKTLKKENAIYYQVHFCKKCFVYGGLNSSSKMWEEHGDFISLAWGKVFPLVKHGFSEVSIAKELGLQRYIVMKMVMYLVRQGLLNVELITKFMPSEAVENPVTCFQLLAQKKGSDINNARQIFNWGQREFFYYYFDPEVQVYLTNTTNSFKGHYNRKRNIPRNKKVNQDRKIPVEISSLWEQAKLFVNEKQVMGQSINRQEIYPYLGTTMKTVKKYCFELFQWIEDEINKQNQILKALIEESRKIKVTEAVISLMQQGIHPSYEKVSEVSGVPKRYMFTHPLIRVSIEEAKKGMFNSN